MKIEVEVPDWTKAITVSYVYYADGGEGRITMGAKALTGKERETGSVWSSGGKGGTSMDDKLFEQGDL